MNTKYWNQDKNFLIPEIREGYYISSEQKKIWAVQLDLYNQLDTVCKKNNIKYFVYFGTLLGAVRHKGFIPWDDDFDIAMTRDNYDKFIELADCFKEPYYLQVGPKDEMFFRHDSRLRNSMTSGFVNGYDNENYNHGIYLDIYVLDGYCSNSIGLVIQRAIIKIYSRMIELKNKNISDLRERRFGWLNSVLKYVSNKCSFDLLAKQEHRIITRYNSRSKYVGSIDSADYFNTKILIDDVAELCTGSFEGLSVPIPQNTDRILKSLYGDYMRFPSEEKRGCFHEGKIVYEPDIPYKEYLSKYGWPFNS